MSAGDFLVLLAVAMVAAAGVYCVVSEFLGRRKRD